jgi:hypothetical protein
MKKLFTLRILLLILFLGTASEHVLSQLNITASGTSFTENFNAMGSSGTASLPAGFKIGTDWSTGTTATTLAYGTTGTGVVTSTSSGGVINWANGITASSTDRALGFLNTGTFTSPKSIILKLTNNTGSTIVALNISFDYEKYRSGSRQYDWTFFHGSSSTPSTAATNGDQSYSADAANTVISNPPLTTSKTVNLTGLSIASGADYYLKWTFTGLGGSTNGQGIGIDNFSITATTAISSDANLSNLQLSSGTLDPVFTQSGTAYNATVTNDITSITVTPTANESHATIKVNGISTTSGNPSAPINLIVGDNAVSIVVTAQNGTEKTYSLTVTRSAPGIPTITQSSPLTGFGNICTNTVSGPNSFTINGNNLDGSDISLSALPGFTYSTLANGTFTNTLDFSYTGNSFSGKIIYVKFSPVAIQSYNGFINIHGGGVASFDVAASGSGINTTPTVSTGSSTSISSGTAVSAGTITDPGCTSIINYGIEFSTTSGFSSGTQVVSGNLSGNNFTSSLSGLAPNTTYFYKAFATNDAGTSYGIQQSFTTKAVPVIMASQEDLTYKEDFATIATWGNNFTNNNNAVHFSPATVITTGTIPDGTKVTTSTVFSSGSSGGVQKGSGNIVLLSTGSPDNTTATAFDLNLDFSGVNAGTLSFDWSVIFNSTGDRNGSLRVYTSTNGSTFSELPAAAVLNFTNNIAANGSIVNVTLPATFNNNPSARLRFYYHNGSGNTGSGSRPKISIDNIVVTSLATANCTEPAAKPTAITFGTITETNIQGSFTAAAPSANKYLVVMSANSSLASNPVNGQVYGIGDNIGDGSVIGYSASTTFNADNLSGATTYYFFVFPANNACIGGPLYLTSDPLTGNATTVAGLPNCTSPAAQASDLITSNPTINSVQGSFTATTADEYLVLKSTEPTLSNEPVNGQVYNAGSVIGNATVVQRSAATAFTANGLLPNTQYYFYVYSLNSQGCLNGPAYNNVQPLTGTATTLPLPECSTPSLQPTNLALNSTNDKISGTFNPAAGGDAYLVIRSTSATLSQSPVDNTDYNPGDNIGGGIVVSNDVTTSFIANGLSQSTTYYFFIFSNNKNCTGGTKYLTTSPLTGNIATTSIPPNFVYFGNLHSHSDYSDGNKDHPGYTPALDYAYAKDAECLDFLGISEHNHYSNGDPGNLITNYHQGSVQADNFTATHPGFLALYGMEWGTISGGGHVVIYGDKMDKLYGWESNVGGISGPNYDVFVQKGDYTGANGLFKTINDDIATNTFATLAHPNSNDFNNLSNAPYDIAADNAIVGTSVETGPAFSTNTTYSNPGAPMSARWYFDKLLSKGFHVGPTIDHDNHNTTFGKTTRSRTAVIAPSLSKTDIIKAIREMHFYATEDCDAKVDFTINTRIMGSIFQDRNAPSISVTLTDATTNTSGALIRIKYGIPGSGILPVTLDSVYGSSLNFIHNDLPVNATGYYYVDITNSTGEILTSPIWYTRLCVNTSASSIVACESYTWPSNGVSYNESGTFIHSYTTQSGCSNTDTLHLIITHPTTGDTTAIACDNFSWYGETLDASGIYYKALKGFGGCDSTLALHLTINHSSTSSETVTACDSYQWHGTNYTESGDYTFLSQNEENCTNTATLHLTVNHSSTSSETVTACDSYQWHGTNYTESGDYTFLSQNNENCTNTATLHLTVNHSSTSSETVTACDSYAWHGTTYTESGDYTFLSQNGENCTNTATLHLTVNHSSTSSETVTACDSYVWHGITYTTSGDYYYSSLNSERCTNTATLHLTINPLITWYADADGDGYGNAASIQYACTQPSGYVGNYYDCDDTKKEKKPEDVKVMMCHNGKPECVNAKDIQKKLDDGWQLGPCTLPCGPDQTLLCHDGRPECVITRDVDRKLNEKGGHWARSCDVYVHARTANTDGLSINSSKAATTDLDYHLSNFPNPFSVFTVISYTIPSDSKVSLKIYNASGQAVATMFEGTKKAGSYTDNFNASRFSNGFYYCKLVAISNGKQVVKTLKLSVGK